MNEADIGNMLQAVRKSKIISSTVLDNRAYTDLKYQYCKLIDIVDLNTSQAKYVDLDSEINNEASLDNVRDYISIQNHNAETQTENTEESHKKKRRSSSRKDDELTPREARPKPTELGQRIKNTLKVGVSKEPTTTAKSLRQINKRNYKPV